jgi:hypothetical protein
MGQPVKLLGELVDDARAVVPFSQRSIAASPSKVSLLFALAETIYRLALVAIRTQTFRKNGSQHHLLSRQRSDLPQYH